MSQAGSSAPDMPAAPATQEAKPTEKEAYLFYYILTSITNKPEIDWDLVATKSGYSNGPCARARYSQIRKRLGLVDDKDNNGFGNPSVTPSKSPRTPGKAHAKKENGNGGSVGGGGGSGPTPTKVTKPRASRSKKAIAEREAAKREAMVKNEVQSEDELEGVGVGSSFAPSSAAATEGFQDEIAVDGVHSPPHGVKLEFASAPSAAGFHIPHDQINYGTYGYHNPLVTLPQSQPQFQSQSQSMQGREMGTGYDVGMGYQVAGEHIEADEYHARMQAYYAKHQSGYEG